MPLTLGDLYDRRGPQHAPSPTLIGPRAYVGIRTPRYEAAGTLSSSPQTRWGSGELSDSGAPPRIKE